MFEHIIEYNLKINSKMLHFCKITWLHGRDAPDVFIWTDEQMLNSLLLLLMGGGFSQLTLCLTNLDQWGLALQKWSQFTFSCANLTNFWAAVKILSEGTPLVLNQFIVTKRYLSLDMVAYKLSVVYIYRNEVNSHCMALAIRYSILTLHNFLQNCLQRFFASVNCLSCHHRPRSYLLVSTFISHCHIF